MTSTPDSIDDSGFPGQSRAVQYQRDWYDDADPLTPPPGTGAAVWVWSPKGGTGTSTVAVSIAARAGAELAAMRGQPGECLLIDCAAGDLRHLAGCAPRDYNRPLIDDAATELALLDYDFAFRHNYDHPDLSGLKAHAAAEALFASSQRASAGLRLLDLSTVDASSPANFDNRAFTGLLSALCAVAPVVVVDAGRDPRDRGLAAVKQLHNAQPAAVLRNCYMSLSQSANRPQAMLERAFVVVEPRRGVSIDIVEDLCSSQRVTPIRFEDAVARACDAGSMASALPPACLRFEMPSNVAARLESLTKVAAVTDPDPDLPDPGF